MTATVCAIDSSALVRRYLADRDRALVLDTMCEADHWAVSGLARTELELALRAAAPTPLAYRSLASAVRDDIDSMWEVPLDGRCLARASDIGAQFGLGVVDAIHLAAADRLPRPLRWLTFERQQIPAAVELGFEVVSPFSD